MKRDPRTPTSVTRIGDFTIRVYSEELYLENILQHYPAGESKPTPKSKSSSSRTPGTPVSFPKKKNRVSWVTPIGLDKKGA